MPNSSLRVRSLLLALVFVPTLGTALFAVTSTAAVVDRRASAQRLHDHTIDLDSTVDASLAVSTERNLSSWVTFAQLLDVDRDELAATLGMDIDAALSTARTAVDRRAMRTLPRLRDHVDRLDAFRAAIDQGDATVDDIDEVFGPLMADLEETWDERFASLRTDLASTDGGTPLHEWAVGLQSAFDVLSENGRRGFLIGELVRPGVSPEDHAELVRQLAAASSRQQKAEEDLADRLGPIAARAWRSHLSNPGARRFDDQLDELTDLFLSGEQLTMDLDDPVVAERFVTGFGEAAIDGEAWTVGVSEVVLGGAADLREGADAEMRDATSQLWAHFGAVALVAVATTAGTALISRSLTRPIRRLQASALEVRGGRFDLPPLRETGPRELADTVHAFNDMTTTLSAVERLAIALAENPNASLPPQPLAGRTGHALHLALEQLRLSMQRTERYRRELEHAATHDPLTGLLNRRAAFDQIERDLARVARGDACAVMLLFVDLDGLKAINDEYGHGAGDDAIRQSAMAIRSATRDADVVARLGGDEFLIAGLLDDDDLDEAERFAQRVCKAVADSTVDVAGHEVPLRCSIGVTLGEPGERTVETVVLRADDALYRAKRDGGNHVTVAATQCLPELSG